MARTGFWCLLGALGLLALFVRSGGQQVETKMRVDCFPEPGSNQALCQKRGCIWDSNFDSSHPTVPLCYFPADSGYSVISQTASTALLGPGNGTASNPYGTDFSRLQFSTKSLGKAVKVQIAPQGVTRFRPPVPLNESAVIESSESLRVDVRASRSGTFSFSVTRVSSGIRLWDTSLGALFFSDKFLQIATYLPSEFVYGFGENNHKHLKHDFSQYTTWGMFARDQPPDSAGSETQNLYGVHPFYLGLEDDGKAHGVFIFNGNAQEVTTGPAPHLTYRSIGGQLEVFFFPGPRPEDVVRQYEQVIGKPFLPAYWAFGFQLCRYGYTGVQEVMDTVERQRKAGIPQDVQFADIDYMQRYKDFTFDGDKWGAWPNYTDQLHQKGMHVVLIFDPAIAANYDSFQRALSAGAKFIEWPRADMVMHNIQDQYPLAKNTNIMLGVVWPDVHVGFPDFLDPSGKTNTWWAAEFERYHKQQAYDGIWIDMNEPSNFGTNQDHPWYYDNPDHPSIPPLFCPMSGADAEFDMPPYPTKSVYGWGSGAIMASNTVCMCGRTMGNTSNVYNTKNLYGWSESVATYAALKQARNKRGIVLSRSTFPSSGKYAGHWLGDNTARWEDLRTSVVGAQEFNMFGITYVGSDICGFIGTTTEELCLRWQQMGAFHSFMRNHNTLGAPAQDPAQWPSVATATRKHNLFRYRHIPFLNSLHFHAARFGGTVVRPVFFEFPQDAATHALDYQFMWGSAVMVVPVVHEGATSVEAYLPTAATWFSLFDSYYGSEIPSGHGTFAAPWTALIPVFLRAGHILPRQTPALTTTAARKNNFQLAVAVDSANNGTAHGELYWDDGDEWVDDVETHSFTHIQYAFQVSSAMATLTMNKVRKSAHVLPSLDNIEIFGYNFQPNFGSAHLNGIPLSHPTATYSPFTKVMNITVNIDMYKDSWTLQWKND